MLLNRRNFVVKFNVSICFKKKNYDSRFQPNSEFNKNWKLHIVRARFYYNFNWNIRNEFICARNRRLILSSIFFNAVLIISKIEERSRMEITTSNREYSAKRTFRYSTPSGVRFFTKQYLEYLSATALQLTT